MWSPVWLAAAIASLIVGAPNLTLFDGPITRYCVELLDTTIANTTTTTFAGAPVDSAYADYRSSRASQDSNQRPPSSEGLLTSC